MSPMETQPALGQRLWRLGRLIRKELSEILRDRRTILTLVLMPLLLYPLLSIGFRQFFLSRKAGESVPTYHIGFLSEDDYRRTSNYLALGERLQKLQELKSTEGDEAGPIPEPKLIPHQVRPELATIELFGGQLDVYITFDAAKSLPIEQKTRLMFPFQLHFRGDSSNGRDCATYLQRRMAAANTEKLAGVLEQFGERVPSVPVAVLVPVEDPDRQRSFSLAALVPLILILMTITGAVYPAIDLTAGERERGTLDILVASPVSRLGILFAKYVAVVTVAMLTALVNLLTMVVTLYLSGLGSILFRSGLTYGTVLQVFGLLLLFAAFFSAVLLILTSFARSFKEAQAYLVPLMLMAIGPGLVSLLPGIRLEGPLLVTPLLNIVLLARDLFEARANAASAGIVVLSTLLFAFAALALAAKIFGAEAVLYSGQGSWSDLLRKPEHESKRAGTTAALLCLAFMFPVSFLFNGLLGQLRESGLEIRLVLQVASNLLLFLGFPLVACWRGNVRLRSGFGLHHAPVFAFLAAVFTAIGAWAISHELILAARSLGFTTLSDDHRHAIQSLLESWRSIPLPMLLLAQAIVPAIVEEFFFRGYLLGALRGSISPRNAVIASGALFGIFHLLLGGILVVERVVPSMALGIILGWLAVRAGSIWPGILLHVMHNSLLVTMGYYEEWFQAQGFSPDADAHLPLGLILVGAATVVLGVICVRLCHPKDPNRYASN